MADTDTVHVTTHHGEVVVHVCGNGPTVVLLHANPGSSQDFAGVVGPLAQTHRVVAVDWPGYGVSPAPDAASFRGAVTYRDCLVEVLDDLATRPGWGPFVLVGSSVGGFAALGAARVRPELVAGLVLVAPGGFTAMNPATRFVCRTLGRPGVARRVAKPLARAYLRRRNDITRAALRDAGRIASDPERRAVFSAVWRSFTEPDHDLRTLRAPAVPTMLCWGRWDPVLPRLTDGRRAARVLQTPLRTYPSGHEPYAELPDRWRHDVEAFLETVPATDQHWIVEPGGE